MPAAPPGGGAGVAAWILALLRALGTRDNGDNSLALGLWSRAEGAPDWRHNWLNTTMPGYGGHPVNSVGVRAYPTFGDGIRATAATIRQPVMSGIFYALTSGLDIEVIWEAIHASPWSGHTVQHHYPDPLYDYIHGLGTFPGGTVVAGTRPADPTDPPHFDWSAKVTATAKALNAHVGSIKGYARAIHP